jgi:hypothetical protein
VPPRAVSSATLLRAEARRRPLPDPSTSHGDIDRQCLSTYQQALGTVVQLLECRPCAANLAAQGYDTAALLQRFQEAAGALGELPDGAQEWMGMCSAASVQLERAGLALLSFATPYACNSPACRALRAAAGQRAQLCVRGLPGGALLQQGLPTASLEAAQASVPGPGSNKRCSNSSPFCCRWALLT